MLALTPAQFSMWYRRADAGDLGRIRDGHLVAQETEVRVATPTCSPPVPPIYSRPPPRPSVSEQWNSPQCSCIPTALNYLPAYTMILLYMVLFLMLNAM